MTDKPTPKEIDDLVYELRHAGKDDAYSLASAVLAKWGQPAVAGEPVAWLDPWTGTRVTTDYDAYGKHGTPLYTAPQPVEREPLTADEQDGLYWRLHSLSKSLEGRGRIDEYDTPDAYRTILDAMNALRDKKGGQHGDAKP